MNAQRGRQPRQHRVRGLAVASLSIMLTAAWGCGRAGGAGPSGSTSGNAAVSASHTADIAAKAPPALSAAPPAALTQLPSLAPLVKKALPSVVTVVAWVSVKNAFGRETTEQRGVGSAFVYDAKGYLLTNNHVIENTSDIVVKFADGVEVEATVVGKDKFTDVAVLKVTKPDLVALPLGDSKTLQVGDWVVAIGSPFGLEQSVSAGIISAKGRRRRDVQGLDQRGYFNFLQTDASINPGNSGGPLLNLAGQAVGINSAVRANANNIGFAIPMQMVVKLLPKLLKHGRIERSGIGISVAELSPKDGQRRGSRKGARITKVLPGQPGALGGLAVGDIITKFDGELINNPDDLRWHASIAGVNKTVTVTIMRGERTFELRLTLSKLGD